MALEHKKSGKRGKSHIEKAKKESQERRNDAITLTLEEEATSQNKLHRRGASI